MSEMPAKKHAGGRPPKKPEERASISVRCSFRLTPKEADALYLAAMRKRKSVSRLLRDLAREVKAAG